MGLVVFSCFCKDLSHRSYSVFSVIPKIPKPNILKMKAISFFYPKIKIKKELCLPEVLCCRRFVLWKPTAT